jgi:hypothetical protein
MKKSILGLLVLVSMLFAANSSQQIKQSGFSFMPKVGFGFQSSNFNPGLLIGGSVGYGSDSWGRIYVDFGYIDTDLELFDSDSDPFAYSLSLVYEKQFNVISLHVGAGFSRAEWHELGYYYNSWTGWGRRDESKFIDAPELKLGFGYDFDLSNNFTIKPALEFYIAPSHEQTTFLGLVFNFRWK